MIKRSDDLQQFFKEKLPMLWEYTFDSIIVVDRSLKIRYINPEADRMLKQLEEETDTLKPFEALTNHLDVNEVLDQQRPKFNISISFEGKFFTSNVIPVDENLCLAIIKDLTKVKEAEEKIEAIEETNKELNDIIDLSADGLVSIDGNGILLRMNEAYEKIVNIRAKDFLGKPAILLKEKGVLPDLVSTHVLKDLKPKDLYLTIRGKEVLLTGRPVFNSGGKLIRIVANIRDLTELNNLKEQIQRFYKLTSRYKTELERLRAKELEGDLIGSSVKMKKVVELVVQVAEVGSTVLIYGETGTGKEITARMVHRNSRRKEGPFITVNCGALTTSLLESELFGYVAGAFTGADKNGKMGLFEAAEGGTLFLDEIGEMPMEMQVKLLRAIQEKKIRRIGGNKEISVNVRLVAATNKDLKSMVEKGEFREDLFYRLNVLKISLPPLRVRKEDIPDLVDYFLERFNRKYGFQQVLPKGMIARLVSFDWPGNVRQLENTIERLVVLSRGLNLDHELLNDIIDPGEQIIMDNKPLKEILEYTEREIIFKAYKKYGSTRKAARKLGISQATVSRKLQKYKHDELN
ncbi:sigma 54-interacting transcriptional regulator [Metallumcola ferriviriculae]|uniref:HTH-type transcriptional regulatory protein TyrR n=1 Tax=Metallumcola ferriviriculae TaxID=3039180 RepID=A0AAU0UNA8_9FIRM|nr:sigma 54-interacting transcriptional regulator [Desulfitibacteraceae bacterium MK1]